MVSLSLKSKYNSPRNIFKTLSGFIGWTIWILVFFLGTVKGNVPGNQLFKATKPVVAAANNSAHLPSSDTDPLQLPEEVEGFVSEADDESDDENREILTISCLQLFTLLPTNGTQSVQSFHYRQSRQQIVAIPLFVLHHSWKSHLD